MSVSLNDSMSKGRAAAHSMPGHFILFGTAPDAKITQSIKILHLEDSIPGKAFVRELLRRDPQNDTAFHITQVDRTVNALEELKLHHFDLVLADLQLLDSDGIETITALRAASPATPIIIHSGSQDNDLLKKALEGGVRCSILKGEEHSATFGPMLKDMSRNDLSHAAGINKSPDHFSASQEVKGWSY